MCRHSKTDYANRLAMRFTVGFMHVGLTLFAMHRSSHKTFTLTIPKREKRRERGRQTGGARDQPTVMLSRVFRKVRKLKRLNVIYLYPEYNDKRDPYHVQSNFRAGNPTSVKSGTELRLGSIRIKREFSRWVLHESRLLRRGEFQRKKRRKKKREKKRTCSRSS